MEESVTLVSQKKEGGSAAGSWSKARCQHLPGPTLVTLGHGLVFPSAKWVGGKISRGKPARPWESRFMHAFIAKLNSNSTLSFVSSPPQPPRVTQDKQPLPSWKRWPFPQFKLGQHFLCVMHVTTPAGYTE